VSLHQQGKLDQAAALYETALSASQHRFDSLNNLALLRLQQGRPDDALKLVRKALYLKPNSAEAHNTAGLTLAALNRHDEAITHYRKSVAIKPDFADAHCNLGSSLSARNRNAEAVECYQKALAIGPDRAAVHTNLGNTLRASNRYEEAIASYQRALALNPDEESTAKAYGNLGQALRELGRIEEAQATLEKAVPFASGKGEIYMNLADCLWFTPGNSHLAAMEALARDMASLPKKQQTYLHFALAKAYTDLGQHEQAIGHLHEGNAQMRREIDYNQRKVLDLFDRIQSVFTIEMMRSRAGLGDQSALPIFVLGMPRSGTTLVEQILASHPNVFGAGELPELDDAVTKLVGSEVGGGRLVFPELIPVWPAENLSQLARDYVRRLKEIAPTATRVVDKMPANFRFVGLIHLLLPNARIIHTRRDPVDTCLSCYSKLFSGDQPYTYDLGELGRYYRAYEKLMGHWRNVLSEGVMLDVQYEEVVADLEGQARRIVTHCGLDWHDACLAFHKAERPIRTASATQVRKPIYRSSIGRWRPYAHLLRPLLEALDIDVAATPAEAQAPR